MKNEIEQKDEKNIVKKGYLLVAIGIIMALAGFLFPICAAFMQGNGMKVNTSVIVIGFFGCNAIGIILMYKAYPSIIISDYIRLGKKYDNKELDELENLDKENLKQSLLNNNFKYTEQNYYINNKASALRGDVNYYIRIVDDNEIQNAVMNEVNCFNTTDKKGKIFCLILFVYMDNISENEKREIKEVGKGSIITETVNYPHSGISIIVIGVDSHTNTGYFMDIDNSNKFSLYASGCNILKELK